MEKREPKCLCSLWTFQVIYSLQALAVGIEGGEGIKKGTKRLANHNLDGAEAQKVGVQIVEKKLGIA